MAGQDFGSVRFNAEFDMLAPGMTESSITGEIGERYEQFFGQKKSVDHFTTGHSIALQ